MKSPKHHVWKWRIALMILVAWICLDGVEIITQADVRPPRRRRGVMISPEDLKKKEEITVDIGKSLVEIAQRASRQSANQMVDLVLVIDGSLAMTGPGRTVEERVVDMANTFEESIIDYQFGLVWFQMPVRHHKSPSNRCKPGSLRLKTTFAMCRRRNLRVVSQDTGWTLL